MPIDRSSACDAVFDGTDDLQKDIICRVLSDLCYTMTLRRHAAMSRLIQRNRTSPGLPNTPGNLMEIEDDVGHCPDGEEEVDTVSSCSN